jgi:hypothetical protein
MGLIKRGSRVPRVLGGSAQQPDRRDDGDSRSQQWLSK